MIPRKPPAITIRQSFLHGLAAVAVSLLFSSCQHKATLGNLKPIYAKIDRERHASLEPWKTITIQDRSAIDFGTSVSAMLASLDVKISLFTVRTADEPVRVTIKMKGKPGKSVDFGSAVPISSDGYFLTAAHCVGKKGSTIQLLVQTASPPVTLSVARVVWRSDDTAPNEPDLAILHTPIKPEVFVRLAAQDGLKTGMPILASGFGSIQKNWAGGYLLSITPPQPAPSGVIWRKLTHSAPFTPGDSGGPMLSAEGELLGINTSLVLTKSKWLPFGLGPWHYEHGVSFIPDPAWLNSIIQSDRAWRSQKF